jgi:tetratricopeptide (TPR) repeat protein
MYAHLTLRFSLWAALVVASLGVAPGATAQQPVAQPPAPSPKVDPVRDCAPPPRQAIAVTLPLPPSCLLVEDEESAPARLRITWAVDALRIRTVAAKGGDGAARPLPEAVQRAERAARAQEAVVAHTDELWRQALEEYRQARETFDSSYRDCTTANAGSRGFATCDAARSAWTTRERTLQQTINLAASECDRAKAKYLDLASKAKDLRARAGAEAGGNPKAPVTTTASVKVSWRVVDRVIDRSVAGGSATAEDSDPGLGAAPQRNTPLRDPGDTTIIMPFAFQPRRAPSGQFKSEQFDAWLRAVRTHQPGQFDEAALGPAVLTSQALSDVVAGFERQIVKKKDWPERIETAKRAVLLHTDIAVGAARLGHLDEMNESLRASLHLGAAMELVGYLQIQQARKTRDPFAANWWLAVAALLGEHREPVSAILFMRRALVQVPGDAAMLLMAGALHELLASPLVLVDSELEAGEELKAWRGTPAGNLREAERLYREALEADPAMTEARVRLGRVLEQQGRYDAALGELGAVVEAQAPRAIRYYRDLFAGEASEGLRRDEAARDGVARTAEESAQGAAMNASTRS